MNKKIDLNYVSGLRLNESFDFLSTHSIDLGESQAERVRFLRHIRSSRRLTTEEENEIYMIVKLIRNPGKVYTVKTRN